MFRQIYLYILYKDMVSIGYVTFSFFKPFEIHLSGNDQVFRPEMPETAVRSPWKHVGHCHSRTIGSGWLTLWGMKKKWFFLGWVQIFHVFRSAMFTRSMHLWPFCIGQGRRRGIFRELIFEHFRQFKSSDESPCWLMFFIVMIFLIILAWANPNGGKTHWFRRFKSGLNQL